jgi:putative endonuclease
MHTGTNTGDRMWNQQIGKKGESLAARYLEQQGVEILDQNYRTEYGEIDLIGLDQGEIVFFEVKTRTTEKFGVPELAITPKKLERMAQCAEIYMQENGLDLNMRMDIIAILMQVKKTTPTIEWIKNVTEAN